MRKPRLCNDIITGYRGLNEHLGQYGCYSLSNKNYAKNSAKFMLTDAVLCLLRVFVYC